MIRRGVMIEKRRAQPLNTYRLGKRRLTQPPESSPVRIPRFLDRQSTDFDLRQISCAQAGLFGQQQVVIAETEWLRAARSPWVLVTHHRGAHRIRVHRVAPDDEHPRRGGS